MLSSLNALRFSSLSTTPAVSQTAPTFAAAKNDAFFRSVRFCDDDEREADTDDSKLEVVIPEEDIEKQLRREKLARDAAEHAAQNQE